MSRLMEYIERDEKSYGAAPICEYVTHDISFKHLVESEVHKQICKQLRLSAEKLITNTQLPSCLPTPEHTVQIVTRTGLNALGLEETRIRAYYVILNQESTGYYE